MGRCGVTINKFTIRGRLVHSYASVSEAVAGECTTRYYLEQAMITRKSLNGFIFSSDEKIAATKKVVNSKADRKNSPEWEGADGNFNIDGWARTCL